MPLTAEAQRELRASRREAGLCTGCGNTPDEKGSIRCDSCKERSRRRSQAHRERILSANLCHDCAREEPMDSQKGSKCPSCRTCYLRRVSRTTCGEISSAPDLLNLFNKQEGKCAYTGLTLTLGGNAHLDHVKPTAKHPELKSDPSNWQWVHRDVNYMKRALSHEKFISLCQMVVKKQ